MGVFQGFTRGRKPGRAAFVFIFITVMLDMIALGIIVPVLPKLVLEFKSGNMASAAAITGVFGFFWALMQFFFAPILGVLSDRFGRRPVLLLSSLGLGLDYILMALAPSLTWLFVGRLISGITASTFSTAGAYVADVTPPEKRAARFGFLGASFGLGFIVGPAVGGLLGAQHLRLPFWASAALCLLNVAYGFFVLPESLDTSRRARFDWRRANPMGSLKLLRSNRQLLMLAGVASIYYIAHEALPSVFVLYTHYRYGWDESTVGLVLAAVGVSTMLVSALLIRPVVGSLGERRAMLIGLSCGALGFGIYGVASSSIIFFAGIFPIALMGLTRPSMQSMLTQRVGPNQQGELQGALSSMRGIMGMIGPLLFTQTFAFVSRPGAPPLPGAPYLLASALLVVAFLLSAWVIRPLRKRT